jgi:hypothetical protein
MKAGQVPVFFMSLIFSPALQLVPDVFCDDLPRLTIPVFVAFFHPRFIDVT